MRYTDNLYCELPIKIHWQPALWTLCDTLLTNTVDCCPVCTALHCNLSFNPHLNSHGGISYSNCFIVCNTVNCSTMRWRQDCSNGLKSDDRRAAADRYLAKQFIWGQSHTFQIHLVEHSTKLFNIWSDIFCLTFDRNFLSLRIGQLTGCGLSFMQREPFSVQSEKISKRRPT